MFNIFQRRTPSKLLAQEPRDASQDDDHGAEDWKDDNDGQSLCLDVVGHVGESGLMDSSIFHCDCIYLKPN